MQLGIMANFAAENINMNNYSIQYIRYQLNNAQMPTHNTLLESMLNWYRNQNNEDKAITEQMIDQIICVTRAAGMANVGPIYALELLYIWITYQQKWKSFIPCANSRKA
jgi:hypothetical protein